MCPPWPSLESLGGSEPEHSTGSSSHKLKQLVTKADCKSLENQSKPRLSLQLSGAPFWKAHCHCWLSDLQLCGHLATVLQVPAPALPQSLALPWHPREAQPCLRSPWAPEPVSPDTDCLHPRVQLLLRHVLRQAPATSPKICGGQPAQPTFFSLSLFFSPKRRIPRTDSQQLRSPQAPALLCWAHFTAFPPRGFNPGAFCWSGHTAFASCCPG